MKIMILSTGDELLKGQICDTNAAWMAAELVQLGQQVSRVVVVGDAMRDLVAGIREGLAHYDFTLVGGGLGPTVDDLTAQAAAEALQVPLVHDAKAEAIVRARFAVSGRPMPEINLKQALLPQGAQAIKNPNGTAPGFWVQRGDHRAVFMPGVPRELKSMFGRVVPGWLPQPAAPHQAVFQFLGIGESVAQEQLAALLPPGAPIRVSFRASSPELTLTLSSPDAVALAALEPQVAEMLRTGLFARSRVGLPAVVVALLREKGLRLAVAESCSGGLLGSVLTDIPGASEVFTGGIIAYDNEVKMRLLGVPASDLERFGAVSETVARTMAQGVRQRLDSDLGVGITGIAGPDGGTPEKPVGTVHIALATKDHIIHRQCAFRGYNRTAVKRVAAWTALKMIYDAIGSHMP